MRSIWMLGHDLRAAFDLDDGLDSRGALDLDDALDSRLLQGAVELDAPGQPR
jgi:hypothetical protein